MRVAVMASILLMLVIGVVAGGGIAEIVADGIEQEPGIISHFPGHGHVRYFTHATLAYILTDVDPQLAARQWWRAASYAPSEERIDAVVAGLTGNVRIQNSAWQ